MLETLPSRRDRKKERTRRDIYEAAIRLFLVDGFAGVTIDHICAAADVARATFFLHFPTKDALLMEYAREVTADITAALAAHTGSAADAIRRTFTLLADRALAHPKIVRLVVEETMRHPEALAENQERSRDFVGVVTTVVTAGQKRGEFRTDVHPSLAAAMVVSAYMAIVGEWAHRGPAIDLRATLDQALDILLQGLTPPRPTRTKGVRR